MDILTGVFIECWNILAESAPYILFGFFAAGVLKRWRGIWGAKASAPPLKHLCWGSPCPCAAAASFPPRSDCANKGQGRALVRETG
jgi:hypothetical protein